MTACSTLWLNLIPLVSKIIWHQHHVYLSNSLDTVAFYKALKHSNISKGHYSVQTHLVSCFGTVHLLPSIGVFKIFRSGSPPLVDSHWCFRGKTYFDYWETHGRSVAEDTVLISLVLETFKASGVSSGVRLSINGVFLPPKFTISLSGSTWVCLRFLNLYLVEI